MIGPSSSAAGGQAARDGRGLALISSINGLLRASRIYSTTNQAFQERLQEFVTLAAPPQDGETSLVTFGGQFYLDGERLRPDPSRLSAYHGLMSDLDRRGLAGVRLMSGLTAPEAEAFLKVFLEAATPEHGKRLPDRVAEAGVTHLLPVRVEDLNAGDDAESGGADSVAPASGGERASRVYWRSVMGVRRLLRRTAVSGRPALREARRVVQPMVDELMRSEYSLIGLTALKDHDFYTYSHCVNVSVLSIGMGQVLGLGREDLSHLGVAALVHDVGKVTIPGDVLRKPGRLEPEEWRLVQRHPLEGVKILIRMPGLSAIALDSMRVCLEHHLKCDETGYPRIDRPWRMTALSRVVAVADCYDAITAHRAYRRRPYTTFEALQYMLGPERGQFEPVVLWALVRTVGLYPAGSVLLTSSKHLVMSLGPTSDVGRPKCRVLLRPDGTEPTGPEVWPALPAEEYVQSVLSPEEHAYDIAAMLAA